MSVGNTNSYIDHAGDGSSAQFAFGFPAISANDIKCRITHADGSTEELQSTAYSVVLSGTGGSVTVAVPPVSGETLRIYRTTPITQNTGFDTGYINNADISNAMDKLTLIAQELKRAADGTMFSVGTVAQGSPASADIEDGKLNLVLPKGDKGDTGAAGPSNTLSIGTVEGGATASATITGTSPNQTLNLVLPKGDKGDTGNTGEGLQTLKAGTYPTYDSNFAPYPLGALLWYPAGGYFVRSLVDNNTESDLTDTTKWAKITVSAADLLQAVPTGSIQPYAGASIPAGWLLCDGSAVSRTDYAALFTAIGTLYGTGDGSTTFNLPDFTDKTFWGGTAAQAGTVKAAGLPDITASVYHNLGDMADASGAFSTEIAYAYGYAQAYVPRISILKFKASDANDIYGNSNTVQPPAIQVPFIIKY